MAYDQNTKILNSQALLEFKQVFLNTSCYLASKRSFSNGFRCPLLKNNQNNRNRRKTFSDRVWHSINSCCSCVPMIKDHDTADTDPVRRYLIIFFCKTIQIKKCSSLFKAEKMGDNQIWNCAQDPVNSRANKFRIVILAVAYCEIYSEAMIKFRLNTHQIHNTYTAFSISTSMEASYQTSFSYLATILKCPQKSVTLNNGIPPIYIFVNTLKNFSVHHAVNCISLVRKNVSNTKTFLVPREEKKVSLY